MESLVFDGLIFICHSNEVSGLPLWCSYLKKALYVNFNAVISLFLYLNSDLPSQFTSHERFKGLIFTLKYLFLTHFQVFNGWLCRWYARCWSFNSKIKGTIEASSKECFVSGFCHFSSQAVWSIANSEFVDEFKKQRLFVYSCSTFQWADHGM